MVRLSTSDSHTCEYTRIYNSVNTKVMRGPDLYTVLKNWQNPCGDQGLVNARCRLYRMAPVKNGSTGIKRHRRVTCIQWPTCTAGW